MVTAARIERSRFEQAHIGLRTKPVAFRPRTQTFRRDKEFDLGRIDQHVFNRVLEQPVLVGHALAQMHELEPGFDEIGFLEAPEFRHVLEQAPREGAVSTALLAKLVDPRPPCFESLAPTSKDERERTAVV